MGPGIRTTVATRRALHQQYVPVTEPPRRRRLAALYPGEPEACRRSLRPFLRNLIHLGLLLAVFRVYHLEERNYQGRTFQNLVTLALLALPVHYLAPFRWKKPCFVVVSIAGLFWVGGAWTSAIVLAMAVVLIGVCYLPIPWVVRAGRLRRDGGGHDARPARGCLVRHPRQRLAHHGIHVHVPDDDLSL